MTDLQSTIILCKNIKLDKNYVNVLDYSENEMIELCKSNSHLVAIANDYSFIRNKGSISTNFKYEDALRSNYIAFQNKDYSNKWFFAFIDSVVYNGEQNTEIFYTVDSWSTWFSYWQIKTCLVNREHVNDDSIGANIIDESLNVGEYINAEQPVKILNNIDDYIMCMAVSELPDGSLPENDGSRIYNGIYSGLFYLAFETSDDITTAIKMYDIKSKADAISYLFMIPKELTSVIDGTKVTWTIEVVGSCQVIYIKTTSSADNIKNIVGTRPNHVGKSYIPKNNKLFIYPYNYSVLTNNNGVSEIFRYEDFTVENNNFGFWVDACITPRHVNNCNTYCI